MTEEHGFLGNTQNILVGTLLSVTRYEISDRNMKGGAIWVSIPNSGENPNVLGVELLKIPMPYAMFEQQQQKEQNGDYILPAEFEILTEMRMGGGNRPALFVKSMRPVQTEKATLTPGTVMGGKPATSSSGNSSVTK